ncbi:GD18882 [Drosophila simulans]|uniref:GD18882 n=1 Tax=Drosophila simulans TaxID=7240 RepID=B4R1W4_DROSI|nr:GD18882 [Drosophila simulans]
MVAGYQVRPDPLLCPLLLVFWSKFEIKFKFMVNITYGNDNNGWRFGWKSSSDSDTDTDWDSEGMDWTGCTLERK